MEQTLSDSFQEIILKRRSNRSYDQTIQVPDEVIQRSLERAILSPNSSNMQLWEFYWIKSRDQLNRFTPLCLNQNTAIKNGIPDKYQKRMLNYYTKIVPFAYSNDWFGLMGFLRWVVSNGISLFRPMTRMAGINDTRIVVHKSCALAAQTFMLSIAAEGYESCPMEGFDQVRARKALGLPRQAEIGMIVSVGKGTEKGIWGKRLRVPYDEVVKVL
ncbi:MAG: nitroreductase family protein [Chitinophagaceae bacterium]|nr:nitroreductase family protein [Chitinophagaceae bacterium]